MIGKYMKLEGSTTNLDYLVTQLKSIADGLPADAVTGEGKTPTFDETAKLQAVRLQAINMLMTLWATKNEL